MKIYRGNKMADPLRRSGIDILENIPWGTHLFQFIHTSDDLAEVLYHNFKTGLLDNKFRIWMKASYPIKNQGVEKNDEQ